MSSQNRTDCPVNSGLGVQCTPDYADSEEYSKCIAFIRYQEDENQAPIDMIVSKRFIDKNGGHRFLETAYNFACSVNGGNLDDVISKYRAQNKDEQSDW